MEFEMETDAHEIMRFITNPLARQEWRLGGIRKEEGGIMIYKPADFQSGALNEQN